MSLFNEEPKKSYRKKLRRSFLRYENSVAVYTVLCVLLKMKDEVGLEAMLEYMEKYIEVIGSSNKKLRKAVFIALENLDSRKIYEDLM